MKKTLVIIPHYNKIALLKECIFHLQKQTTDNFDIIIVDNGSSDGSDKYIFDLSNENSNIKYILLNENMGFAYAVNRGIEYSIKNGYKYSLLLNNDAYVDENFVNALNFEIEKHKSRFAISSFMVNYHDMSLVDSFGDNYCILGWAFQNRIAENINNIDSDEICFSACAGASIYRNDVFEKIGLFDEKFFAYLEDIDISYRAKLYGYSISTCKNAICYHLGSATSGSKYNEFKVRMSARNNIYLIYKNMPLLQIIINFKFLLIGYIIKQIFFIFKGFGLDYFFGIFDGFRNLKYITCNRPKNFNIYTYIIIEIELIINFFKYVINYFRRH